MRLWVKVIGIVLAVALAGAVGAVERKVYFFGNSLIHHLSDSDETAVPHWLAKMAETRGDAFLADGQWGFLREFAGPGAPLANWSFREVASPWDRNRQAFGDVGWDAIVVNPANFIQDRAPDAPYEGDNPDRASPLSALLALIDAHGGIPVYLYEGWAEMGERFPPRRRAFERYKALNQGAYHDWYVDLVAELRAARPGREIWLIPVAKVLAELFSEGPLKDMAPEALYVDTDPHGTPTLYLLAAMVTWSGLTGEAAPVAMDLPDNIAPEVRRAYPLLAVTIALKLKQDGAALGGPVKKVAEAEPAEEGEASGDKAAEMPPAVPPAPAMDIVKGPAEGLADPALAMGLNGISDWSTEQPFIDIMKTARPWLGHEGARWGAWDAARLAREGYLDKSGWVMRFPPGVDRIESFVLTDQAEAAEAMRGRYRVRWAGAGTLKIGGRSRQARYGDHEAWFSYAPGDGEVAITLLETDPEGRGDYIRNIEILREDQIALHELGVVFNPGWTRRIADLRVLRFMDWMMTNGSPVTRWEERPLLSDFSYAWCGVPAETMIELANLIGADPWVCMPHAADDGYSKAFAELVKARLDPRLKVHVEYSNELWNFIFPQARWAAEQASALWGAAAGEDAWMQFAGKRAAEVMAVWSEVFGDAGGHRLKRVVAVHTGWPGLEEALLEAPLWPEGRPAEAFDAYAVSGYFGYELGDAEEGRLADLRGWIGESREAAAKLARDKGLKRRALEAAIEPVRFDLALPKAVEAVRDGSLKELLDRLWPYHAGVAQRYGLELVMYEGGSHAVGHGAAVQDEDLTAFFAAYNYAPGMGALYAEALAGWRKAGGHLFNAFVDVARPMQHGSWGALRHLEDDNPRWQALMAANEAGSGMGARAPGTFLHGVIRQGGTGADVLEGTVEEDILLGREGDDVLVSRGGGDFIGGGPGRDVARLIGRREDYAFAMEGTRLLAIRGGRETRLHGIEILEFDGEPGRQYRLELPN